MHTVTVLLVSSIAKLCTEVSWVKYCIFMERSIVDSERILGMETYRDPWS